MKIPKINLPKVTLSTPQFIILFSIVTMLLYHFPLYAYAFSNLNFSVNGILTFLSMLIALFIAIAFLLFVFALISPLSLKIFSIFTLVGNSLAVYFITTYEVILDKTMMGNVFNTNFAEATSYYHPKLFLFIIFLGIVPSIFIAKIKIKKVKRLRLFIQGIITFFIAIFILYLNATTWLWFDKHAKKIGAMMMPASYIGNSIRYEAKQLKRSQKQTLLPAATFNNQNKMVVILVIGESARAQNFSLLGYPRPTNPELKQLGVSAVNATSASTYTTASVNSMLSYTGATSDSYEPLPSYLQRLGADVTWRTSNWGEPKLKVQTYERGDVLRDACKGEGCDFDELLLTNLSQRISESKKEKIFIVLHTYGSHGPLYFDKIPTSFKHFKPTCETVDLKECTSQELINTYDNTILYTDHFLSKVIALLNKNASQPSLMVYASDHGESLGEYGLYLHGTPFVIAPDMQKKVPFIFWASKGYLKAKGMKKLTINKQEYGHKNIFHTIIGAFDVNSSVYNKKLDLLQ